MVPDIDWGKNIRIALDIGCKSAGFGVALLEKDVITLSLGLTNDQTDLAQIAIERGIPATIGSLGSRRLPFPSGAFDVIHCSECNIPWHSNGMYLLLLSSLYTQYSTILCTHILNNTMYCMY
jgi:tRNA wybutosine-synthesizing protein 1